MMYLLSLLQKDPADVLRRQPQPVWAALLSVMGLGLMLVPAEITPGVFIDMRAVPIALLAFQQGLRVGLLGLVPLLLYRWSLGGLGVVPAVLSAVGVVVMGSVVGRGIDLFAPRPEWRTLWWKVLLIFLPNGLLLPLFRGQPGDYLSVYLPLLVLGCAGFLVTLSILRNRDRLLRLVRKYEVQAYHDALSSLPNRRQFDLDVALMTPDDLLCLVDIDHFKAVNDTYGHAAGDEVLTQVGQLLRSGLRPADGAYRYGGEEFAVILRSFPPGDPALLAERLRRQVERATFGALEGQSLTVSVGVAQRGTLPAATCVQRADMALYAAKNAGRNRVALWSPDLPARPAALTSPSESAPAQA